MSQSVLQTLTILTYHYVRDPSHSRFPKIKGRSTPAFAAQIDYVGKHYSFVTMADCIAALEGLRPLPQGAALLTFDDGYLDHFTNAFPALAARGIQGSFFPSAKAVLEDELLDVNKIHFALASAPNEKVMLDRTFALLDELRPEFELESNDAYWGRLGHPSRWDTAEVKFMKSLLQHGLPKPVRARVLDSLFREWVGEDEAAFARELYMNEDQIRCLLQHGMYVGSHGYEHLHLDTLSATEQRSEIERSTEFLDRLRIPREDWVLCYPHGAYDDSTISIVAELGFRLALTTRVGLTNLSAENAFRLERLDTNDLPIDADAVPNEWTRRALG